MRQASARSGRSVAELIPDAIRKTVLKSQETGLVAIWDREPSARRSTTIAFMTSPDAPTRSSFRRPRGVDMFDTVTGYLGDGVLMYASDHPRSECQFPNSIDNILAWTSLKPDAQKKLLGGNAARFFKQT